MSIPQYEPCEYPMLPPRPDARRRQPVAIIALVGIGLIIGRYYLPHQQRYTLYGNPPIRMDHETGHTWQLHNGIWETIDDDSKLLYEKTRAQFDEWERQERETARIAR